MGQATSSPTPSGPSPSSLTNQPAPESQRRRRSAWRRSLASFSQLDVSSAHGNNASNSNSNSNSNSSNISSAETSTAEDRHGTRPRRPRSVSMNRLSQLLRVQSPSPPRHNDYDEQVDDDEGESNQADSSADVLLSSAPQRPSRLHRARTSLNSLTSAFSSRRRAAPSADSPDMLRPALQTRAATDSLEYTLPSVNLSDLDLGLDDLTTTVSAGRPSTPRTPSRRSSLRLPTGLSDRISGFRPERLQRGLTHRRRRPLQEGGERAEDNTALLSRLLSVAAAATAATLLEGNQQAISEARSVAGDGDDGTFSSFLQSLESGRLAAALRGQNQDGEANGATADSTNAPLNFFRMFRFGTPSTRNNAQGTDPDASARSGEATPDGRMVPIIIVGIRSVSPSTAGSTSDDHGMPPFLDALSTLPTTPFGTDPVGPDSIDNILRPSQTTRFSHRRRASMGGVNSIASGYDAQRHHRSPERVRPISMTSDPAPGQRPPPVTPASPALSRVTSTNSIPATSRPQSTRSNSAFSPRRESIIRTTTTTTLETTTEDAPLRPRPSRPRRLSESDYTRNSTYNSRRNGIVEPDDAPPENTRSWIIYVLGGSYPENHPILTTPSLFTDSPTYEDMMLLSALLGPAKPPVASEHDVAQAPGLFKIESIGQDEHGHPLLFAVATDTEDRIELAHEQRCLVCLCDFEVDEQARRLVKCGHLFHKECIDEWLTKGRNSCPLCRGQGVDEKEKGPTSPTFDGPPAAPAGSPVETSSASSTAFETNRATQDQPTF